jgi:two-component system, OmpR family, sensor histidine kinase VicK
MTNDLNLSSSSPSKNKIEVWYRAENVINKSLEIMYSIENQYDLCISSNGPIAMLSDNGIRKAYYDLKNKGVIIRIITDVTNDNLDSCRELSKIAEIHHLSDIIGNFVIADRKNFGAVADLEDVYPHITHITELIHSTVPAFVKQQQRFFDMLWKKAIPAKQMIKEIVENLKREFIETIQDFEETLTLVSKVTSSATEEILIMFSHANILHQYEKHGILDVLKRKAENEVVVRILIGMDHALEKGMVESLKGYEYIEWRPLLKSIQITLTTIVSDRELSLLIEEKDNEDIIGLTIYSNSESTVFLCFHI